MGFLNLTSTRGLLVVKYPGGGGQFDPGFYFELLTPKLGVLTILVYSIVNRSTNT